MLKIVSSVCAAAMVLSLPLTTPGFAMPKAMPDVTAPDRVMLVQEGNPHPFVDPPRRGDGRDWRRGDREWRGDRRVDRRVDRDWVRRGDSYYLRGHRGYRSHRPGYRQYNGWWFPPAAFIAGAIIGGAMNPPVEYRPRGNAHIDWCYARYRSYRASDNTFQPYNGPRRQCLSPYS
jgi:hypothetical protein